MLPLFTKMFNCYNELLNHWKNRHEKDAIQAGFEKQTTTSTNGLMYELYLKDLSWFPKESWAMPSEIRSKAVAAKKQTIKHCQEWICYGNPKRNMAYCPRFGAFSSSVVSSRNLWKLGQLRSIH